MNTPTGPKGLPFVGNSLQFAKNPLDFFTKMAHSHGDLAFFRFGRDPAYLVAHPDMVREVLINQHKKMHKGLSSKLIKAILGNGMLVSEGDFHRRQRRLAQPAFTQDSVAGYGEIMIDKASEFEQGLVEGRAFDMNDAMLEIALVMVTQALIGRGMDRETTLVAEAIAGLTSYWYTYFNPISRIIHRFPTKLKREFVKQQASLNSLFMTMVEERRKNPDPGRHDLLTKFLDATDETGQMSDEQVKDELAIMLIAGHETTGNALTWAWYLLAENPEAEARFHQELDQVLSDETPQDLDPKSLPFTRQIMTEALRLYPAAWTSSRYVREEIELNGHRIAPGALLYMPQWVVHRDERWFTEALAFKPERWDDGWAPYKGAYYPFGAGPRQCIGERFAWMEAVLILATLGRRWRFTLVKDHPVVPQALVMMGPKHGMMLVPRLRERPASRMARKDLVSASSW